jgi:hypothetical protein
MNRKNDLYITDKDNSVKQYQFMNINVVNVKQSLKKIALLTMTRMFPVLNVTPGK